MARGSLGVGLMAELIGILGVFGLVVVALSAGVVALVGHRNRHRWGQKRELDTTGGAYRGATFTVPDPNAHVPGVVTLASTLGLAWAATTALLFSPAGLLLAWVVGAEARVAPLASAPVCLVALHGFVIAAALVAGSLSLMRARPGAAAKARAIALWSALHHGAVLLLFAGWMLVDVEPGGVLLALSVVPCGLGIGHAALLHRAAEQASYREVLDEEPPRAAPPLAAPRVAA